MAKKDVKDEVKDVKDEVEDVTSQENSEPAMSQFDEAATYRFRFPPVDGEYLNAKRLALKFNHGEAVANVARLKEIGKHATVDPLEKGRGPMKMFVDAFRREWPHIQIDKVQIISVAA